jgi:hypothetical protein
VAPPAPAARPSAAASFHGDDDVPTVARPRPDLKSIFGDEPAPAAPAPEEFDPPSDPEPARAARSLDFDDDPPPARAPSNGAAPSPNLADLMGDLGDEEHEHTGAGPIAVSPGGDPFAAVPDAPQMATSQIGEQTRFFMKKAGVTNRNPWWKYAIFILLVLGLPVAVLYGLGKAGVGGTVVIVDASTGEEKQVAKFSLENIKSNGLAALLSGSGQHPAAAPKRPKKVADGDKKPTPVDPNAGDPKANLTAEQRKKLDDNSGKGPDLGLVPAGDPKDKPAGSGPVDHSKDHAGPAVDKGDGLSSEVVAKVVADNTSGFNKCVEDKLKRDSSWKGGKINLTVKIGPSGTVLESAIDKADVAGSDVGTCILGKVKRMHFPRFGGEEPQEVQFPLLLTNGG